MDSEQSRLLTPVNADDLRVAINSGERTFVLFYADWCAPCRHFKGMLEVHANELKALFDEKGIRRRLMIDTDENHACETEYGVRGIPTWRVYEGANQAAAGAGAQRSLGQIEGGSGIILYNHFAARIRAIQFQGEEAPRQVPA
jgi:thiol:disulfide interchange protein